VTFMEMMRQAAARSQPEEPPKAAASPAVTPAAPAPEAAPETPVEPAPPQAEPTPPRRKRAPVVQPPALAEGESDDPYAEAKAEQRVQRVKRRKAKRRRQAVGVTGGIIRSFVVVLAAAGLLATIFTWWTPSQLISNSVRQELSVAIATNQATAQPTGLPTPNWLRRIGIVSGHRGPQNDPGAVCTDAAGDVTLKEADITFNVSQLVVRDLKAVGYTVDLLDEFDPRLNGYKADAFLSIHANTCQDWPDGEIVSGFLVSSSASRNTVRGEDNALVNCLDEHYAQASGLEHREYATEDMTDYHSFREIDPLTPAAVIELGFLRADGAILTGRPDELARGISDGILCYLEPGNTESTPSS